MAASACWPAISEDYLIALFKIIEKPSKIEK